MRFLRVMGLTCVVAGAGCGNVVIEGSTDGGGSGGSGGATTPTAPTTATTTSEGAGGAAGGGGDIPTGGCAGLPDDDLDGDGFSPAQGDCNDCDPMIGPASAESPTPDPVEPFEPPVPADEDCDGLIDEPQETCDDGLALDATDAMDAARAIDLCSFVSLGDPYGVVAAGWVQPDGEPLPEAQEAAFHLGHGILPDLGQKALAKVGSRLLAISNGTARRPIDPGYSVLYSKGYSSAHPPGMPFEGPCFDVSTGAAADGIALEMDIVPPVNALGFKYHYRFYTRGWPKDACLPYNDQFAVLMWPPPMGALGKNINFDDLGNPITLSWLKPWACKCGPQQCPQDLPCLAQQAELAGSGFDELYGASTDWLVIAAPIQDGPKSFRLRFLIYDAADGNVDSTAVVDGFSWITTPPQPISGGPPDD
jgi:hypothetical protein